MSDTNPINNSYGHLNISIVNNNSISIYNNKSVIKFKEELSKSSNPFVIYLCKMKIRKHKRRVIIEIKRVWINCHSNRN